MPSKKTNATPIARALTTLIEDPTEGLTVWAAPSHKMSAISGIENNLDSIKSCIQDIAKSLADAPSTTKTSKFSVELGLNLEVSAGKLIEITVGGGKLGASITITMEWSKTGP